MQFAHFGVLDAGSQSKGSLFTSLAINLLVALVVIVVGAAARQTMNKRAQLTKLTEPVIKKKVEPVKPKVIPPKPKLPDIVKVEQPKILLPQKIKLPELPKQPIVKMEAPKPVMLPPAPKQVIAMAAPKAVSFAHPQAASVVNNDEHPTAVRLGNSTSPIKNLKGPAVATPVNLMAGMPGMNSANTGNGPRSTKVVLGNGSPGGTSIRGNGVVAVAGIPHGVSGATGTSRVVGQVNLGQVALPSTPRPSAPTAAAQRTAPKVLYKPKPVYTAEARQLHIEGTVTLRIRVQTNGSVEVIGVISGLGHGLNESAEHAILATKFEPATDVSGHPIVWDGVVNVAFQLAG